VISLQNIIIDGIPIFKSSSTDLYPIFGMCLDFVDSTPFSIAVFCGSGKPESIDMFLESFITEVKLLKREGIHYKNQCFNFDIAFLYRVEQKY
jgi:hypothetical protein